MSVDLHNGATGSQASDSEPGATRAMLGLGGDCVAIAVVYL